MWLLYAFGRLRTEQFTASCLRRARWVTLFTLTQLPAPAVMRQLTKIDEAEGYILSTFYKSTVIHCCVLTNAFGFPYKPKMEANLLLN
jgi:hypothetical protein